MFKKILRVPAVCAVIFFALFHFGCATLQPSDIPEESLWEKPEPLILKAQADVIQMRLDLLREKSINQDMTVTTVDASYKESGDLISYHYLGSYVGNGLFVDINGNVGVDIIRLLGFDRSPAFKLHRTRRGSLDAPEDLSLNGKTITINEGDWGSGDIVTEMEENGYSITASSFFPPDKIAAGKGRIEYIPSGLFSNFRASFIQQDGNITRGSTGYRVEQTSENAVSLNGSHEIVVDGNKIILKDRGRVLITIIKSGSRYVFFQSESYGSWIEKLQDRIIVSDNGSVTEYTYEAEEPPVTAPRETKPAADVKAAAETKPAAAENQRASRAKIGREKIEKRTDRKTRREASSPLPPN